MKLDLNDLYYFTVIAERRSFSAAADTLGIPKGTLSKRFRALEQVLGVRLANRTTRTFSLTEAGLDFHEHTVRMVRAACNAEQAAQARLSAPVGRVRISCAAGVARLALADLLPEFLRQYSTIDLELLTSGRYVDVLHDGFDIAVCAHTDPLQGTSLIARQIAHIPIVLVASPHFFAARTPTTPEALDGVVGLPIGRRDTGRTWQLFASNGRSATVTFHPRLLCNDSPTVRHCALSGLGVAALPAPLVCDDLAAGRLIRVLPDWRIAPDSLSLVLPSRQGMTQAVRATVDFLAEALPKYLNDCETGNEIA